MNVSREPSPTPLQKIGNIIEVALCSLCGLVLAIVVVGLVVLTIPPHESLFKPLPEDTPPAESTPAPNGD